jgi:hypothetical protein
MSGFAAAPAGATIMNDRCGPGLVMLGVRGTGEAPGMGNTVSVVKGLFDQDKDVPTWSQAVTYPATAFAPQTSYGISVQKGAIELRGLIKTIVNTCPYVSIALVGYSQGAQVVGNVLTGTDSTPLTAAERPHILAVTLFGDPTYRPGEAWDASGDGAGLGLFASLRASHAFSSWTRASWPAGASAPVQKSIVKSWCYTGDRYCQTGLGSDADAIHASYRTKATYDAYSFIRSWLISPN